MKPVISLPKLTLLIAVTACLAGSGSAATDLPISGQFKGTVEATANADPPGALRLVATGTGVVSHLGKAVAEVIFPAAVLDLANGELTFLETEWHGTITTANGDQIFGTYTLASDTLPISPDGKVHYAADLTVTGGTGRFENATGRAVANGAGSLVDFSFKVDIIGVISGVGGSGGK